MKIETLVRGGGEPLQQGEAGRKITFAEAEVLQPHNQEFGSWGSDLHCWVLYLGPGMF